MSATPDTTEPPITTDAGETTPRPAPTRTGWATLRPLVLRLHFYAGVFVAPFLAIACLTGLVYVFSPQLSDLVYADELFAATAHRPGPSARRPGRRRRRGPPRRHPQLPGRHRPTPTAPPASCSTSTAWARTCSAPSTSTRTPRRSAARSTPGGTPPAADHPRRPAPQPAARRARPHLLRARRELAVGARARRPGAVDRQAAAAAARSKDAAAAAARDARRTAADPGLARGDRGLAHRRAAVPQRHRPDLVDLRRRPLRHRRRRGEAVDAVAGRRAVPVRDGARSPCRTRWTAAVATGLQGPLKVTVPAEPGAPFTVAEIARDWPVQRDEVALDPYTGAVTETILWQRLPGAVEADPHRHPRAHGRPVRPVQPARPGRDRPRPAVHDLLGLPHVVAAPPDPRRRAAAHRTGASRHPARPARSRRRSRSCSSPWSSAGCFPSSASACVLFVVGDAIAGEISPAPRAMRRADAVSPACHHSGTGCPPGSRNDSRARSRRSASGRRLRSVRSCPPLLPAGPRHVVRPRGGGLYSPWTRWAPNNRRRSTTASALAQPENDPLAFGLITGSSGVPGGRSAPLPGRRADNPLRLTTRLRAALLPSTIIRWRPPALGGEENDGGRTW